jgi:catechol 2,3-dioxygenase-like lactoylglutathione lyase family enzyme
MNPALAYDGACVFELPRNFRLRNLSEEDTNAKSSNSAKGTIVIDSLTLGSPTHVVIGATDLDASIDWWTAFGFGVVTENALAPDVADGLFGLAGDVEQVELRVDEAPGGAIWLVQTPRRQNSRGPFDSGPHAVEIYTTDMDASVALAADLGAILGGQSEHLVGNVALQRVSVLGPDEFGVIFTAFADRQSSVLDIHPEWLHSEIHSIVSTVRNVDTANRFWSEQLGMTIASDSHMDSGLESLLQLPRDVSSRVTVLCDEFSNPIRYAFIEFKGLAPNDRPGNVPTWPLPPARPLACFTVADVAASAAQMFRAGATLGDVVDLGDGCAIGGSKAIWGLDPNGTRFILAGH